MTERFRHYIRRIHIFDRILPDGGNWDTKKPNIRQDFIWGAGPSAVEIITKGEFNTDPDTIKTDKLIHLFRQYYMPKRNSYYSSGDFFWVKLGANETREEHWKKLVTLEKNCDFKDLKQEDFLISKFITSITNEKLRVKLSREKTLNLKTTVERVTQNSCDRRQKQSTLSPVLAKDKGIKRELIQKLQATQYGEQRNQAKKNNCGFCGQQNWTTQHNCPAKTVKRHNCQKIGHFARVCRGKPNNNTRKINYLGDILSEDNEESEL